MFKDETRVTDGVRCGRITCRGLTNGGGPSQRRWGIGVDTAARLYAIGSTMLGLAAIVGTGALVRAKSVPVKNRDFAESSVAPGHYDGSRVVPPGKDKIIPDWGIGSSGGYAAAGIHGTPAQYTAYTDYIGTVIYQDVGALPPNRHYTLRDRAKITSHFPAGPFGRWLRCRLLTDPLAGYARRLRLASSQNFCAVKHEFIFARSLRVLVRENTGRWGAGSVGRIALVNTKADANPKSQTFKGHLLGKASVVVSSPGVIISTSVTTGKSVSGDMTIELSLAKRGTSAKTGTEAQFTKVKLSCKPVLAGATHPVKGG